MPIQVFIAAFSAVIIFGASPVAAKIAVNTVPVVDVALLRTVIAGLLALPVALLLKIPLPANAHQRWLLLLSGFCGFVGFPVLFTLGVQLTSANHASMILAALPVFTGAIAMVWDRGWPRSRWWLGCCIALVGESVLIFSVHSDSGISSVKGDLLVLASNVFASVGYVAGGRLQRSGYAARGTTFWGVAIFALLLIPVLPFVLHFDVLRSASLIAWSGILYLAIGVTIIGYMMWYWALGAGGIAKVGLIQFLQPISGVILASLLLAEGIEQMFLFASALILAGVWLAMTSK